MVRDAERLRFMVGLAGQHAAVDELLTGRRNLEMFGRLYHLPKATARRRAEELLERFDLAEAANRPVKTYSGGMRRRLDVAASLIVSPPVLFMDEPTTGLDPRSRLGLWELLRDLVGEGTTLLLTTQYLDEADRLADQIVVLDQGRVAAAGSPAELKRRIGGDRVQVVFRESTDVPKGLDLVRRAGGRRVAGGDPQVVVVDGRQVTVAVEHGAQSLIHIAGALDAAMIPVEDLSLRRPTLDEVFLHLTAT